MRDTYKEVVIMLTVASSVFLVLAGIVIFILLFYQKKRFQHRRQLDQLKSSIEQELLKTQLETQEHTFRQIADELHDNVGQLLSSTKILLSVTERQMSDPPKTLLVATDTLARAIQDLRSLSKSLNKEWLQRFNLIANLEAEADRINITRAITVKVHTDARQIPLPAEAQVMLFRIVQEALQNCIKHAHANNIGISITTAEEIIVQIRDDGQGLPVDTSDRKGLGLLNMEHRTHLLGGDIRWESAEDCGTTVNIFLPFQKIHT